MGSLRHEPIFDNEFALAGAVPDLSTVIKKQTSCG
jgi:hypothetical protein